MDDAHPTEAYQPGPFYHFTNNICPDPYLNPQRLEPIGCDSLLALTPALSQQILHGICIGEVSCTDKSFLQFGVCCSLLNHSYKEPVVCVLESSLEVMCKHRIATY